MSTSRPVTSCQSCGATPLDSILFLGYLPPVNLARRIGSPPIEEPSYPAELLRCRACQLVQLGLVVDKEILFPRDYPYTSSTTKILRENFAELPSEIAGMMPFSSEDLVIDVGSNDGNLLSNFVGKTRVLGITPEDIGAAAVARGIPTIFSYFDADTAAGVVQQHGQAKIVTATNVFAHIDDPNQLVENVLTIMKPDGIFLSESHYFADLIRTVQYDAVYHEHLRYYTLTSLAGLLGRHGLEVFHAKRIPTHGGSIRVYAAKPGRFAITQAVSEIRAEEADDTTREFSEQVAATRMGLWTILADIQECGASIYGIGAPSRASTLVRYTGLDAHIIPVVLEADGSSKIGLYMPGTRIPIEGEARLYRDQPEYALLFSWHIADELIPKIRAKGFRGSFIVPLPIPKIIEP